MIARPILRALDWAAVVLMAYALRHGTDAVELERMVFRAYRHKTAGQAQAEARSKMARAVMRNTVRAARRGRAIIR